MYLSLKTHFKKTCSNSSLKSALAHVSESQSAGKVTYTSDKEDFIHFDSEGTIIESNLPKNENQNKRATLNYSTGRWVYF